MIHEPISISLQLLHAYPAWGWGRPYQVFVLRPVDTALHISPETSRKHESRESSQAPSAPQNSLLRGPSDTRAVPIPSQQWSCFGGKFHPDVWRVGWLPEQSGVACADMWGATQPARQYPGSPRERAAFCKSQRRDFKARFSVSNLGGQRKLGPREARD